MAKPAPVSGPSVSLLAVAADEVLSTCPVCGAEASRLVARKGVLYNRIEELTTVTSHLCLHCSVIYTNPRLSRAKLADFYRNQQGGRWSTPDARALADRAESSKATRRITFLLPFLPPAARVLEVGCGEANFVASLARRVPDATVTGLDPALADEARPMANLTLVNAHIDDTFLPATLAPPYDCVAAFHVLEHQHGPVEFLVQLGGLLHDSGTLYLEVPNTYRSFRLGKDVEVFFSVVHLCNYSRRALTFLLHAAGFEPLAWDASNPKALRVISRRRLQGRLTAPPPALTWREVTLVERYFSRWKIYSRMRRAAFPLRTLAPFVGVLAWRRLRPHFARAGF
jgi:2-polyprenyl-3-methyl-5-hydroxy-6-metoxy-1,4-benzoquinol methylase